jgi:hypothetical protein
MNAPFTRGSAGPRYPQREIGPENIRLGVVRTFEKRYGFVERRLSMSMAWKSVLIVGAVVLGLAGALHLFAGEWMHELAHVIHGR